jgi:predicted protein tyrosine phosphatase
MESYIIAYIAQRMANLGFMKYGFEPLLVIMPQDKNEYQLDGTNEYYYLVSRLLATGTEISSGSNHFKVEEHHVNLDFSKIQEFTGQIKITSPQGVKQAIEFIRVIPQYHGKEQIHA